MRHSREPDAARDRVSTPREQSHMPNTLYDTLEVIPTASPETIHAAYRSLISRYHPDRVAGLGTELQAIASARTKEINHAYDVLRDAKRRASYDEELRERESPSPRPQDFAVDVLRDANRRASYEEELHERESPSPRPPDFAAERAPAAVPPVPDRPGHFVEATLVAAAAGTAALLALPQVAAAIFGVVDFFATGHARYFQDLVNSIDTSARYSEAPYLLILWGWLFANYLSGLISYRFGVAAGQRMDPRFGEPLAGTNDRLLLLLTFVCVIAGSEWLSSAHTMPNILADMFVLAGAYWAERGIA